MKSFSKMLPLGPFSITTKARAKEMASASNTIAGRRYAQYSPSTSSVESTIRVAVDAVGSSSGNLGPGLKALLMVELASETTRLDAKRGFVSVRS